MSKKTLSKPMNILLWILQIALALYAITGGGYMVTHYQDVGSLAALKVLPQFAWYIIGGLQVLFALGLVFGGMSKKKNTTALSAAGLAIISLLGTMLYVAYSGFPGMLWGIIPAALEAFVAYKRWEK